MRTADNYRLTLELLLNKTFPLRSLSELIQTINLLNPSMFKHFRLSAAPRGIIVCVIALSLCACATMTKSSSQVRVQQLETAQLAFIDNHTRTEGTPAPWDQASFDSEVAKITQQFTEAEAAESKAVPARKEFIKNCADLFQRDAALVRKQHSLSPSFAANKKKQIEQNYNLFLGH